MHYAHKFQSSIDMCASCIYIVEILRETHFLCELAAGLALVCVCIAASE